MFGNPNGFFAFVAIVFATLVPLGIWKAIELIHWLATHVRFE